MHEEFKCDICDKGFVLNWRLGKHMKMHSEKAVRHCYYFNNNHECPFAELGCKFLHKEAKICLFGEKCQRRLCPFKHPDKGHAQSDTKTSINEEHVDVTEEKNSSDDEFLLNGAVFTSTPNKVNYECEECNNGDQCTDSM